MRQSPRYNGSRARYERELFTMKTEKSDSSGERREEEANLGKRWVKIAGVVCLYWWEWAVFINQKIFRWTISVLVINRWGWSLISAVVKRGWGWGSIVLHQRILRTHIIGAESSSLSPYVHSCGCTCVCAGIWDWGVEFLSRVHRHVICTARVLDLVLTVTPDCAYKSLHVYISWMSYDASEEALVRTVSLKVYIWNRTCFRHFLCLWKN